MEPTKQEAIDHTLLRVIILMAAFAWVTVFGLVGYIGIRLTSSVDGLSVQLLEFKMDISQRLTKVEARVDGLTKEHP